MRDGYTKKTIQMMSDHDMIDSYIKDANTDQYFVSYDIAVWVAKKCTSFDEWWGNIMSIRAQLHARRR